jgi:hypothetical protein
VSGEGNKLNSRPSQTQRATSGEFNPERKRYPEGFMSGLQIARAARAASGNGSGGAARPNPWDRCR